MIGFAGFDAAGAALSRAFAPICACSICAAQILRRVFRDRLDSHPRLRAILRIGVALVQGGPTPEPGAILGLFTEIAKQSRSGAQLKYFPTHYRETLQLASIGDALAIGIRTIYNAITNE